MIKGANVMSDELKGKKPSLLGMVVNPKEQFDRIKERPVFVGALISIIILTCVGMWLSLISFDITKVANLSDLQGFTTEELAAFEVLSKLTFIGIELIGSFITVVILSLLFLLFAKSLELRVKFKEFFSMNIYVLFVVSLGILLNGLITVLVGADPESIYTSLSVFYKADGIFGEVLKHIEIFKIWGLILTAVGLQKVARYPKKTAWIIAIIFFVFTVVLTITNAGTDPTGGF